MDKPRYFYKDTFHHLYNRGANKQAIFFDKTNYIYFLERLSYYKDKYEIEILSYCFMPNHFHLFVRQTKEELSISRFISSLLNSYTKSLNKSYKRSGTLFESKTKSKQIIDDAYFTWVIKYILENPAKAKLAATMADWEYSNAKDLLGLRNGSLINIKEVVSYFESEAQMKEFLSVENIKLNYEF